MEHVNDDEPLALRELSYDADRKITPFVFMGTKSGAAAALNGLIPVDAGLDPRDAPTERALRAAIRETLQAAPTALPE